MAKKAYECRSGFSLGRGNEVQTQRGSERVFGQGAVYIIDTKDLKEQVKLGWLVEVGTVEATTAAPGEKRDVVVPGPRNQNDEREKRETFREPEPVPEEPSFASQRKLPAKKTTKKASK